MKRRCLALAFVFSMVFLLCGFDSEEQKVYDKAGLFTTGEQQALEATCVKTALEEEIDIIILTQNEPDNREAEEIADDFYDEHGFGFEGPHETGIILVIDMYNRMYSVTTSGYAIEWFTDAEIEQIYDEMENQMVYGDYYGACWTYLNAVVRLKNNAEVAENGYYDPGTQTFVSTGKGPIAQAFTLGKVMLRLVISAVVGVVSVWFLKRQAKPRMSVGQGTYMKNHQLTMYHKADRFSHETVIHRRLPRANVRSGGGHGGGLSGGVSTGRISGGGFRHGGGGGRRF